MVAALKGITVATYIDGPNRSFIKSLKLWVGEDAEYNKVIAKYRSGI